MNPKFNYDGKTADIADVEAITDKMRRDWRVLSICDIVLNHTANESKWLQTHPECTYNLINSPHLRPAYLLDAALHQLTLEIADGKWEFSGIPKEVDCEAHLQVSISFISSSDIFCQGYGLNLLPLLLTGNSQCYAWHFSATT